MVKIKILKRIWVGFLVLIIVSGIGILLFRVYYLVKDKDSIEDTKELREDIEEQYLNGESSDEDNDESSPEGTMEVNEDGDLVDIVSSIKKTLNVESDTSVEGKKRSKEFLDELRKKYNNKDVIGYLVLDGFDVEYPIMQGETNESYIKTSPYGNYDYNGSIFLDYENHSDFSDSRSVMYGHNMINKSMFGCLRSLYEGNVDEKYFTIYTDDGVLKYKVLCCGTIYAYGENYFLYPGKTNEKKFSDEGFTLKEVEKSNIEKDLMDDFYSKIKSNSISWCKDTKYDKNSKVVTLMTCYGDGKTYRFAVSGVLQKSKSEK